MTTKVTARLVKTENGWELKAEKRDWTWLLSLCGIVLMLIVALW
jgi:hypothetical protein